MKDVLRVSIKREFFERILQGELKLIEVLKRPIPGEYKLFWVSQTNDQKSVDFLFHKIGSNADGAELEDFNIFVDG